jgi:predicted transposase YdaD
MVQVIEHLPSNHEALSSNTSTTKKRRKKEGREGGREEGREEGRKEGREKCLKNGFLLRSQGGTGMNDAQESIGKLGS